MSIQINFQVIDSKFQTILRFTQSKEQNGKQNKLESETNVEKKEEQKLPDDFEKLLQLEDPKATQKAKEMYQDLEKKFKQLKEENQGLNNQISSKSKSFDELSKTANSLRSNLKIQIEEVELTRKRLEKEKEDAKIFSISKFAKEILEVQDNLQRALQSCKSEYEGKQNELFEGTSLTYKVLEAILQRNGIMQDNPMGQKFDANKHEAVFEMDHDKIESGKIAYVATVGYKINDRVLRPAKVGVVKRKQPEPNQEENSKNQEQDKKKE